MTARPDLYGIDGGMSAREHPADPHLVDRLEQAVLAGVCQDPGVYPAVYEYVTPVDFRDLARRTIYGIVGDLWHKGHAVTLLSVYDEADRQGRIVPEDESQVPQGHLHASDLPDLFEGSDAGYAVAHARRLRRISLERRIQLLGEKISEGRGSEADHEELDSVRQRISDLEIGRAALHEAGISGDALRRVRARPAPVSPLPGYFEPSPGLMLIQGPAKSGKTSLAVAIAQAWCTGTLPWPDAPPLPGTRAAILSPEQSAQKIDRTLRRMGRLAPEPDIEGWTDRLVVVARDPELSAAGRSLLILDAPGLARLRTMLQDARNGGDPYGYLVLDSLSRLKPIGAEENSNDDMTAFLAPLQALAEETGVYIALIHHVGHSSRQDPVGAGRGASAISAVPQVLWLVTRPFEEPRTRTLRVAGNEIDTAEHTFEVCPETEEPGRILYWRPMSPRLLETLDLDDYVRPGEAITTSELARRLWGDRCVEGRDPPGQFKRLAAGARQMWARAGLIAKPYTGPGKAVMVDRPPLEESD